MADVTVEFGAKDLGLAKTLATVQDELTNLRSKVKAGDLTITDLEQTMRRVGQVESME
jgi:ribosomal protein L29